MMSMILKNPKVQSSLQMVKSWAPLWIGTTLVFSGLSFAYAFFLKQDIFLASQGILVRDEANGSTIHHGRFENSFERKAAQETILDMARNHQVVRNAFLAAGAEASTFGPSANWPTSSDIKAFVDNSLSVHAPKGSELGATEVVYVDVKHKFPERALILNKCLCDALDDYMRQVRETRAMSITQELTQARDRARVELAKATKRLQEIEKSAGSELTDLRSLAEVGGSNNSRSGLEQIRLELRQAEAKFQTSITELQMLENAAADTNSFVVAPGALLNSQPGLKRLREGLVDAQLQASQLSGKFTDFHPSVVAARASISEISQRLNLELQASFQNAKQEKVAAERAIERLKEQEAEAESRLEKLADSRAIYANIASEVKTRAAILENAERELAEAESIRITSQSTSLISKVDEPLVGDKPIGPGRLTIFLIGSFAGLAVGLGLMVVLSPLANAGSFGRRWNDAQNQGRRMADRVSTNSSAPSVTRTTPTIPTDPACGFDKSPNEFLSVVPSLSNASPSIHTAAPAPVAVDNALPISPATATSTTSASAITTAATSTTMPGVTKVSSELPPSLPSEESEMKDLGSMLQSLVNTDVLMSRRRNAVNGKVGNSTTSSDKADVEKDKTQERRVLPRKTQAPPIGNIAVGVRKTPS